MNKPRLNNPNARYWDDLMQDFGFTAQEQEAVLSGAVSGCARSIFRLLR